MSRSRRKTPKIGIAAGRRVSEKYDKRKANRKFRKRAKEAIQKDGEPPVRMEEVSDVWGMAKDGKVPIDPKKYPELMRK